MANAYPHKNPPPYAPEPNPMVTNNYAPPHNVQQPCPMVVNNLAPAPAVAQPNPVIYQVAAAPPPVVSCRMGPETSHCLCRSCNQRFVSRVEKKYRTKAHQWALGLFCIGCWPFCLVPYCMNSCQNIDHFCPSCGSYIGSYMS